MCNCATKKTRSITLNVPVIKCGYFEGFKYKTCYSLLPAQFHVCSYVLLMPSVRNCDVNSLQNERKDLQCIDCVQLLAARAVPTKQAK